MVASRLVIALLALPLAAACGETTAPVDCAQADGVIEGTFEHPYSDYEHFPVTGEIRIVALDGGCPAPDPIPVDGLSFSVENLSTGRYALFLEAPGFALRTSEPHVEVDVSGRTQVLIRLQMTSDPQELVIQVEPHTAQCHGFDLVYECLVNTGESGNLGLGVEEIVGFNYEPGYHYELRLLRTRKPVILQDAGMYDFWLLEIISRTPA